MIIFKTKLGNISLDAPDGNEYEKLVFSGDRAQELRDEVARLRGAYGHFIGCGASGFELASSLREAGIKFEIEGEMGMPKKLPSNNGENGIIF
jgi:hypothetical protein